MTQKPKLKTSLGSIAALCMMTLATSSFAAEEVPVNLDNYIQAVTTQELHKYMELAGGVNEFYHLDTPTPVDRQVTIRSNRDVLNSAAVVNISEGATLTLPDFDDRYMSVMIINENHHVNNVLHKGGEHQLTKEEYETDFVLVFLRTLVDSNDIEDVKVVNQLQSQVKITGAKNVAPVLPNYRQADIDGINKATANLAAYIPDSSRVFGKATEVDPIRFFVGAAIGWGGLPEAEAFYNVVAPQLPVGEYKIEVPADVPVDAFWSITVYNHQGFYEPIEHGVLNLNNLNSEKNEDGSVTVHLGGCEDGRINCIPTPEGWNYIVRMYQPSQKIIDGEWVFPTFQSM